jgi:hypothetical protein
MIPALVSLTFILFTAPSVLAQNNGQDSFVAQVEDDSGDDSDNDNDTDNGSDNDFDNGNDLDADSDSDNDEQTVTAQQYGGGAQTPATGGLPLLPAAAAGMMLLGCSTLMIKRLLIGRNS